MTQDSYFSPIPQPPNEQPSGMRRLVAWLVILAAAGTMFALTWRSYQRGAAVSGRDSDVREMQILIAARYGVGAYHLAASLGQKTNNLQQLADELDGVAKTPQEKLQVAIAVGEIEDASAAKRRLDALEAMTTDPRFHQDIEALRLIYDAQLESLSLEQKSRLTSQYGWFGRLALAYKQPADNADRKAADGPAVRTVAAGVAAFALFLLLLLAGLGLLITGIVLFSNGRMRPAYQPLSAPSQPFLEAFAIYIGGFVAIGLIARFIAPAIYQHMTLYYAALLAPPVLGVLWPRWCGVSKADWHQALGWHTGRGALREIGCGLLGYVAGLPLMAAAFYLVMKLSRFAGANPTHPIIHELRGSGSQVLSIFVLAAVYAPIVEETMFRGALFHALRVRHSWLLSAAITGFLFAAIHPQGWTVIPGLFTIAMIFAAIREWRGTILSSAAAHALNNGTVVLFVVLLMR